MSQNASGLRRRSLLKNLVAEMIKEGIRITHAAMEGYSLPYAIGRYRPDVIGMYPDGRGVVGVVRMGGDDIDSAAARQELKDLAKRISPTKDKPISLYIAIPARVYNDLTEILDQVGLAKKDGKKLVFDSKTDIRIRTY